MLNFLTYSQLDYMCMKQAGNISDSDLDSWYRQLYVNTKMMKIYQMLDGLQNPWYNRSTVLTVASTDQIYLTDSSGITSESTSGNTIMIVSTTPLVSGQIVVMQLVLVSTGAIISQCLARVTTGGLTSTLKIISGSMSTLSVSYHLGLTAIASYSGATIDVSGIYFKDFVKIYDNNFTGILGQQMRMFDEYKDAKLFGDLSANPITSNVGWHQRGDAIELYVPATSNPLGTVMGEYRGKPAIYSDATANNIIDFPPEQNQMLIDEVTASYLIDRGKVVPPDLASRQVLYQKQYEAAESNRIKLMEIKNN
jgi:hypothetical protein